MHKDKHLVYLDVLTHGDQEVSKVVEMPKAMFDRMKEREDDYGMGSHPYELGILVSHAHVQPAVDISDAEVEAHPPDKWLYVAVC